MRKVELNFKPKDDLLAYVTRKLVGSWASGKTMSGSKEERGEGREGRGQRGEGRGFCILPSAMFVSACFLLRCVSSCFGDAF